MKALVAQELSGPSGLVYTDVDDPADVGGHDVVVVDVGAAGVSFPDLLLLRGEYQLRLEPPFIPGMEAAGVVRSAPVRLGVQTGTTGHGADDAERVGRAGGGGAGQPQAHPGRPRRRRKPSRCWAITRRCTSRWPSAARLRAGETVLVLGSAGGVGTAAIQVAKALGAKVIAMVHRQHGSRVRGVVGRRRGAAADRRLAAGRQGPHRGPRRRPGGRPDRR